MPFLLRLGPFLLQFPPFFTTFAFPKTTIFIERVVIFEVFIIFHFDCFFLSLGSCFGGVLGSFGRLLGLPGVSKTGDLHWPGPLEMVR